MLIGDGRILFSAKVKQGVKSYFGRESWLEKICATVSLFILAKDSHDLREATMQLFGLKNPLLRHSQSHTHHLGFAVKLPVTVNRYSPIPTEHYHQKIYEATVMKLSTWISEMEK